MSEPEKKPAPPSGAKFASGLAVGLALGLPIGVAMHNVGSGLAIGVGIGLALGAAFEAQGKKDDQSGKSDKSDKQ
ncbi:MAG: hypothetical protein IT317_20495 [Anaerolineales bacterium]|nr:hypothetical protein [Anaerolineales bacterium]